MEQSVFSIKISRIEVGWSTIEMVINGKAISYKASYLGPEPLASLIAVCSDLKLDYPDDSEAKTLWVAEPGELSFEFKLTGGSNVHIDISDDETEEEWHEDIPFDSFISAIATEGVRILNDYGLDGYYDAWMDKTEFPLHLLLHISGLYDNNEHPTFSEECDWIRQFSSKVK